MNHNIKKISPHLAQQIFLHLLRDLYSISVNLSGVLFSASASASYYSVNVNPIKNPVINPP